MGDSRKYDAFISYRREGGAYIARAVREGIEKTNESLRVFIDLDELAGGNFNEALLRVIADTPNFIVILSKDALARTHKEGDWLRRELTEAIRQRKNIIPVIEGGVSFPESESLPEDIRALTSFNGVEYSPLHHHEAIKKLISFFRVDTTENADQRKARINRYFDRCMIEIAGGEFIMGSAKGRPDEQPPHSVRVSGFWMMKYSVTQREYQALMNVNPANFKNDNKPVHNVSWFDAITFCNKWSEKDGLEAVYETDSNTGLVTFFLDRLGYRLPTEAEWEYACRAGTESEFYWGDSESEWDRYAWHDRNSDDQVHIVGTRRPNKWGLFDMAGNVYEWCNDWYETDYYSFADLENPHGPQRDFGEFRVMRGGAWAYDPIRLRSAARLKRDPKLTDDVSSFRCVINAHPLRTS